LEGYKVVPDQSVFFDVGPDEITLLFYVLGIGLAESLTIDELRVLGSALFITGEVLLTIVSQRLLLNDALAAQQEHKTTGIAKQEQQSIQELQSQNIILQRQIHHLQQQMDQLAKK